MSERPAGTGSQSRPSPCRPVMGRARGPVAAVVAGVLIAACSAGTRPSASDGAATATVAPGRSGEAAITLPVVPEAIPTGSTLIDERFGDGTGAGWADTVGWSRVGYGGRVSWSAAGLAWSWYPAGQEWADYAAHLDVRVDAGAVAVGLRAGPAGRYVVQAGTTGVVLLREEPWGSWAPLAGGAPLEAGRSHALTVAAVGGHIQVWSDGSLLVDHTDLSPLPTGTVTLGAPEGSVVSVGAIRVSSLGADLPAVKPARSAALPGEAARRPDGAPESGPFAAGPGAPQGTAASGGNDLGIGLVRFDEPGYETGDPIEVSVTVLLDGEGPVGPFDVRVNVGGASCEATVQSLSNFGSTTAACSVPGFAEPGILAWQVRVDARDQVAERREDDNSAAGAVAVTAGGSGALPDLVAKWWSTDPVWPPDPGEPVAFRVKVGPSVARSEVAPYVVAVSLDGVVLCEIEVAVTEAVVSCPLDTGIGPGRHTLGIVVDATGVIEEGPGEAGNAYEVVIDL